MRKTKKKSAFRHPFQQFNVKKYQFIILLLLFTYLSFWKYYSNNLEGYLYNWLNCIDYVEQGTLYGGQPQCGQGPVVFVVGYFLKTIVGYQFLQISTISLNLVLNLVLLYLILKVIRQETKIKNYFIPTLFFIILIYPNSINRLATLISTVFVFLSYYLIKISKNKSRFYTLLEIVIGISISIALFSKYSSIYPIAVILVYYTLVKTFKVKISKKGIKFDYKHERFFRFLTLLLTITIAAEIVLILYPNFAVYTLSGQTVLPENTLLDTIRFFLPYNIKYFHIGIISIYLLVLIAAYSFIKERNVYSVCSIIGILGVTYSLTRHQWGLRTPGFYGLPIYPFLIIMLIKLKVNLEKYPLKELILTVLIALMLFLHGFADTPLNDLMKTDLEKSRDDFTTSYESWVNLIPQQNARVLTEGFLRKGSIDNLDMIHPDRNYYDSYFADRLSYLGAVTKESYNKWFTSELDLESNDFKNKIESGEYSLIFLEPPFWGTLSKILSQVNKSNFCRVDLPNLQFFSRGGRHHTILYFRNKEDCRLLQTSVQTYYSNAFDDICKQDRFAANLLGNILSKNNIHLDKNCISGGNLVDYYETNAGRYSKRDLVTPSLIILIIAFSYVIFNRKKFKESDIKLIGLLILILIASSVLILFFYKSHEPWYEEKPIIAGESISKTEIIRNSKFSSFLWGSRIKEGDDTPEINDLRWNQFNLPLNMTTNKTEIFINGAVNINNPFVLITSDDCIKEFFVNEILIFKENNCSSKKHHEGILLNLENVSKEGWDLFAGKIINFDATVFFNIEDIPAVKYGNFSYSFDNKTWKHFEMPLRLNTSDDIYVQSSLNVFRNVSDFKLYFQTNNCIESFDINDFTIFSDECYECKHCDGINISLTNNLKKGNNQFSLKIKNFKNNIELFGKHSFIL